MVVTTAALLASVSHAAAGPCEDKACRSSFVVRGQAAEWRSPQVFASFTGRVRLYAGGHRIGADPSAGGCAVVYAGQRVHARLRRCGTDLPLRIRHRGRAGVRVVVVYRAVPLVAGPPAPEPEPAPPVPDPPPPLPPDPPPPPPDPPPPQRMYWGATIDGETYGTPDADAPRDQTVWNTFESHAGKEVTFVNSGQSWLVFEEAEVEAARARGAFPLVTMGLDDRTTLAEVAAGRVDRDIRAWAQAAKSWGYPFLFRPWWEPNGNWYPWGRNPDYVEAWRHFHDVVVDEGATNVTWAWITNTIWADPLSDPAPYYPGDAYVDWVGFDAYNWGENPIQPDRWTTPEETIGPTLQRMEDIAPSKPVCICELGSTEIGGEKAPWITEMLGTYLPQHPEIKAFLWFNWSIPQNGGIWDWPIESSPAAQSAFSAGIASDTFRSQPPPITPLGKVPMP